jgi:hypothetical protein
MGFCVLGAYFFFRLTLLSPHAAIDKGILPPGVSKSGAPNVDTIPHASPLPLAPHSETDTIAKANSVALATHLQLISRELQVNEAAISALKLTETQGKQFKDAITHFVDQLKHEELAHAYVETMADGGEQIVVPAFERARVIQTLETELSDIFGPEIAGFVKGRLPFDATLAVNDSEMRVYVETGNDGVEREIFERKVRGKPVVLRGQEFDMMYKEKTRSLIRGKFSKRNEHLFAAIGTLPRRQEKGTGK